jgi:hypothetical protein
MTSNNTQAISNVILLLALRMREKNRLEKTIADQEMATPALMSARHRLADLRRYDESDMRALEKLRAEP